MKRATEVARRQRLEHPAYSIYGENLYSKSSTSGYVTVSCDEVVKAWYDEIRYYDFNRPSFSLATGHFTQAVWLKTKRLGCAKATNPSTGTVYVACNYDPPGNVLGQFRRQVPRIK